MPDPTGTPQSVQVTMYNVGFGDCFLLSFLYGNGGVARMLIDCGSHNARKDQMLGVVNQVTTDSGGHVDALVVTHRHQDHLSAFGLKEAAPQFTALQPEVVLQPWTEDPTLDDNATSSAGEHRKMLAAAQGLAGAVAGNAAALAPASDPATQRMIDFVAGLSITNKAALECIAGLSGDHRFLAADDRLDLSAVLPGVEVTVLGPPTLEQCPAIRSESTSNSSQFWQLRQGLAEYLTDGADPAAANRLFPEAATVPLEKADPDVRWALHNVDDLQAASLKGFVRILDDAMNNTSVILLFRVGDGVLLFPGDAQWENWSYCLGQPETKDLLGPVDLYKVGHHGSGNATPKDLWNLFQKKRGTSDACLTALLSTALDQYNGVPQDKLVSALQAATDLHRSDDAAVKGPVCCTYEAKVRAVRQQC